MSGTICIVVLTIAVDPVQCWLRILNAKHTGGLPYLHGKYCYALSVVLTVSLIGGIDNENFDGIQSEFGMHNALGSLPKCYWTQGKPFFTLICTFHWVRPLFPFAISIDL